jgi:DNA-binding NarL/FixJ family response regulator
MDELLDQIDLVNPDIVILDWELPGLEGEASMTKLRGENPDLKVIAMSGLPGVRYAAISAGVNSFIHKTDPPDRLIRLLNTYEAAI